MVALNPYRRLLRQARYTLVGGLPSDEDHNILSWYLSTAFTGMVDGGILVFLPVFLARLGASPALLGLYNSLPALLSILLLIPAGMLIERVTDQLSAMVRLGLLTRLAYLAIVVAPFFVRVPHLPLVIVGAWVLRTVPDAGAIPLWYAVSARAVSPARRGHVNGTRWALMSLISALCQAAFGRGLDGAPFPLGYQAVFAVSFVASVAEMLAYARLRLPLLTAEEQPARAPLRERLQAYVQPLIEHGPFVRYLAGTIGYRLALNMPPALMTLLWVRELRASDGLIGLRGMVGYVALVFGYLAWGRNANRLGHQRVLTFAALGLASYVMVSALLPAAIWLLPAAVLWGLAAPGIDIGLFDLLLHACPGGKQARFFSVGLVATNLAIFLGPLLGVGLANITSVRTALLVAGALQVVATLGFSLLPRDV